MNRTLVSSTGFPRAAAYRRLLPDQAGAPPSDKSAPVFAVRERRPADAFAFTERHLKCAWFDEAVRPALLHTAQGEELTVEDPGRWNLEAGPDFLNAVLCLGPDRRRLAGDVEIHIHPADWRRHAHGRDPAYARVIAHVTWFPGYLPDDGLPRGALQIALKDVLGANPGFSFENLDLTAYPYARRASVPACYRKLAAWSPEQLVALFESAGEERLRRKAERMAVAIGAKGPDQILYEELMSALGYKHNRTPFRTLAEQCPLTELREDSGRNATTAYALLLGIAGLLPAQTDSGWDPETRAFVRQLWDRWWKQQAKWSHRILKPGAWKLNGIRPQNHPRRRLMAAALLFAQKMMPAEFLLSLQTHQPEQGLARNMAWLQPEGKTYWRDRLALGGRRQAKRAALIGKQRAAAMVSNVILPFLAALDSSRYPGPGLLRRLPPEEDNTIVRQAASYLLGPDHNPKLYQTGLRQQGLIQIFTDFCLNDRSRCSACDLLKHLDSFVR